MRQITKHAITYFQINAIGICVTFAMSLFGANSALAEGLKGEEIKTLLIGNTLEREFKRTLNSGVEGNFHVWVFYKDGSTRVVKVQFEFERMNGDLVTRDRGKFDSKWSVTESGVICGTDRKGEEICRKDVRVSGDTVKMTGVDGAANRVYKLSKGNAKDL